jgi:DNA-binding MarR family transcriptional regulator
MTTTPVLTGRDIGITYQAIAAIRDRLLADVGLTFEDSIQLNVLADAPAATTTSSELVAVLAAGLKLSDAAASAAIDELVGRGLAIRDAAGTVTATEHAVEAHERFNAFVAELAPRLYGDIPREDLEAAKRVLDTVTERANRELELTSRR